MPVYQYETSPALPDEPVDRFEVRQHMGDDPLTVHPDTGVPVRRVISGGIGLLTKSEHSLPEPGPGCGPANCGCGRFN
jgi:predicted nucleic acid-binding Zn ribbon protein